ncbi:MAG: 3-oxoacyl-ACP reductase FabG [Clostridia bacterium]|nr:3-oxoacyl-ACP reductase FabG [Clostridia bacterium]
MELNRTALVTGASRGIGRAAAELLAQNGFNVVVHYYQNKAAAEETVQSLKARGYAAMAVGADLRSAAEVVEMVKAGEAYFGKIDVLVNNAGIAAQKLFTDMTVQEWDEMFAIHVRGNFLCSRAVLPAMIARGHGKIVNISSIWGTVGASCEVHYSAAKAAVIGITKALAKEVAPSGVCVNCVAPGVIETDMISHLDEKTKMELAADTPLGRLGTPADVAQAILFFASAQSDFITGQVLTADGGFAG